MKLTQHDMTDDKPVAEWVFASEEDLISYLRLRSLMHLREEDVLKKLPIIEGASSARVLIAVNGRTHSGKDKYVIS